MSIPLLIVIFVGAAAAVWVAGVHLSKTTDILADRFHLGGALGGLILLAIATNLPEFAIVGSAAARNELGVAVGNLLGGVAIQTLVLAVLDFVSRDHPTPLLSRAASMVLVLEAALVIAVLGLAIMASQLPVNFVFHGLAPDGVSLAAMWIGGVMLINRARKGLPWRPVDEGEPTGHAAKDESDVKGPSSGEQKDATMPTLIRFIVAAVVTLIGGVALERSGSELASHVGLTDILFGATVLAAVTSLPELSTGITAIRLKNDNLAISDIFGGNAFLPVLFLLANVVAGKAVLPRATATDLFLTGLGILMTAVCLVTMIFRSPRRIAGLGVGNFANVILYAVGAIGLIVISKRN